MPTNNNNNVTGWVGWGVFAAVVMFISGVFGIVEGLASLYRNDLFIVGAEKLLVLNYTAWGWIHIAIGFLLVAAAASVMKGNVFGRIVGVVLATLSAVANLAFLTAYPVWTVLVIVIDVAVIYALTVHGGELAE